jgi:predicted nucleotidyltransferase
MESWHFGMAGSRIKFRQLLDLLVRHEVEFIIVGGLAAVLEGVPIFTVDLDILHRPTAANTERLLRALEEIHARYRDPAGRLILPDATRLRTNRFNLLSTDLGPLDVLGNLGEGFAYENLSQRTHTYELEDLRVRVLELAGVIELKERANRDKDRAVLPILRHTLEMKSAQAGLAEEEGDEGPGT